MIDNIYYEIHITVELCISSLDKFKKICHEIGVKPIVIDLDYNKLKDVMTSSRYIGNDISVFQEVDRIVNTLELNNYKVIRRKVESSPNHSDAPLYTNGQTISNSRYFESHINVIIPKHMKSDLDNFINILNIDSRLTGISKLSRNFLKKFNDLEYINILTYRSDKSGSILFKDEVNYILEKLKENCFKYDNDIEVEFAIYDSNIKHDDSWLFGDI